MPSNMVSPRITYRWFTKPKRKKKRLRKRWWIFKEPESSHKGFYIIIKIFTEIVEIKFLFFLIIFAGLQDIINAYLNWYALYLSKKR